LSKRAVLGAVALVVLGACAGAAGVLAARWAAPDLSPLAQATVPAVVFAEVSEQPLTSPISLVGTVHPPQTKDVFAPGAEPSQDGDGAALAAYTQAGRSVSAEERAWTVDGTADPTSAPEPSRPAELEALRLVVTVQRSAVGEPLGPGDVVAEVSGRPVFAIPPGMPLYRNLTLGANGADVSALQEFLAQAGHFGGRVGGEFNSLTLAGLRQLYRAAGYDLPLADGVNPGFVLSEFAEVAAQAAPVVQVAPVGTALDGETPLVRIVTGAPWVSVRATILDVEALPVGAEVTVTAGEAEPLVATVSTVGEYQSDGAPGYDLTVPLTVEWFEAAGDVQRATVEPVGEVPVGPAVPLAAVREDAVGFYVLAAAGEAASADTSSGTSGPAGAGHGLERVAITVTGQSGGYALIAADGELPVGRRIVVSGDSAAAG
jgi:hypothetical protein